MLPKGTIRNILIGNIFREPLVIANVSLLVLSWAKKIVMVNQNFW